jgi:peroxiredoxin
MKPTPIHHKSPLAAALGLLALSACVPNLTSPKGAVSDWVPPENSWESVETVPADLKAEGFREGEVAPDIRLLDQNGDEVSLWQFYGDVVAIDLSTMWCGPCQGLAKEVDHVWEAYRDQGFVYITMLPENRSGEVPTTADLNDWSSLHGISAPILSDSVGYAYEIEPQQAWPRVLVIGRDMRIAVNPVIPAEDAAIRSVIEDAL